MLADGMTLMCSCTFISCIGPPAFALKSDTPIRWKIGVGWRIRYVHEDDSTTGMGVCLDMAVAGGGLAATHGLVLSGQAVSLVSSPPLSIPAGI
jgi:hypothetical protein